MLFGVRLFEIFPLIVTLVPGIISGIFGMGKRWQAFSIFILFILFSFFSFLFFSDQYLMTSGQEAIFDIRYNKISIFIGALYTGAFFMGLFPLRKSLDLAPSFFLYLFGGLGLILANNLLTFFFFWSFQRFLPVRNFIKQGTQGTYIFQHLFTFICFTVLLFLAHKNGFLTTPMTQISSHHLTLPVLALAFVIIFQSHGLFPFHSWVHDVVQNIHWYEFSAIFLCRPGILLFAQFLLPSITSIPESYKIILLSLSLFSSLYWSLRAYLEENMLKTTTYFYIAQASLLLTGLQANEASMKGSYLHMMVISFSGTALFSILSYIQNFFSFKRYSPFYGLSKHVPILGSLFCLFGFCLIGVPLGASFVAEDLVINGLLEYHPYLGLFHILATCINGIVFFHAFMKIFLGSSPYTKIGDNLDIGFKDMTPYLITLVFLLVIGVFPSLFLEKVSW